MKLEWMTDCWTITGYTPMLAMVLDGSAVKDGRECYFIPDLDFHRNTVYLWEGSSLHRPMDPLSYDIGLDGRVMRSSTSATYGIVQGRIVDGEGKLWSNTHIKCNGNDYCWVLAKGGSSVNEQTSKEALVRMGLWDA